jgi:hypothetical protein
VQFAAASVDLIEIKGGLLPGDKMIISVAVWRLARFWRGDRFGRGALECPG